MSDRYTEYIREVEDMLRKAGRDPRRAVELDAAVDILTDDGMPRDRAVELMFAALNKPDPLEPIARHIVSLRKALRDTDV